MPRANRKCFLLVYCQEINIQSCFTVLRHAFFIGFPIGSSKPWILNGILVKSLEIINKLCPWYLSLKPNISPSSVTMVKSKSHKKRNVKIIYVWLPHTHYSMIKCGRNVENRSIMRLQKEKMMDFYYHEKYLASISNKILL